MSRNTRNSSSSSVDAWRRKKRRKVDDHLADDRHLQQNDDDNEYYRPDHGEEEQQEAGPPSRTRARVKKKLQLMIQVHQEDQQPLIPHLRPQLPTMITTVKPKPAGRRKTLNHGEEDHHQSTRKEKPTAHDKAKKSPRTDVHPTCTSQPFVSSSLQPLPEKHILELILDTLQRRDTYEIFAEPVDPEQVEDYYEIIKEPMDFGTMRAKLHEGMYTNLEQFEHDAFLISGNAMHFNSSATIFFRQARAIHELSKKVFNVLKTDPEIFVMEFSGTRRRSSRRLQGEAKNLNCRPATTRNSSNVRANASSRGSSCSFNIGQSSTRTSITGNLGVSGTTASGRDLGFIFRARDGIKCCSDEADRRCTYEPKVFLDHENDSFASRIRLDPKPLVFVNDQQDVSYGESLMRFVKDLGPTAKRIAERKLQGLSGDSPTCNYNRQPPTAAPLSFWQQPLMPSTDSQSIMISPILSHKLLMNLPPASPNATKNMVDQNLTIAEDGETNYKVRGRNSATVDLVNERLGRGHDDDGRVNFEEDNSSRRDHDHEVPDDRIQLRKGQIHELGSEHLISCNTMRDDNGRELVSSSVSDKLAQVSSSCCSSMHKCKDLRALLMAQPEVASEKSGVNSEQMMIINNNWNKKKKNSLISRNDIQGWSSEQISWERNSQPITDHDQDHPAEVLLMKSSRSGNAMMVSVDNCSAEISSSKSMEGIRGGVVVKAGQSATVSRFKFDLPFLKSQLSQMKFTCS